MPESPNVGNLTLHGGIAYFRPLADVGLGEAGFRDLGENDTFQLNLADDTTKDYQSKRQGTRRTVFTTVTEQKATITMKLMEITGKNMAMGVAGDVTVQTDGRARIGVKTNSSTKGTLRLVGAADDGNPCDWEGEVTIRPSGTVDFLSDDFMGLDITADIQADDTGAFGYITVDDGIGSI